MAQSEAELQEIVEPPAPPSATASEEEVQIGDRERRLILWLTNVSHGMNHFQGQMLPPLYPLIMADLGIGYVQLGIISAVSNIITNGSQLGYGFVTPFMQRCRLLGIGNLVLALGTFLTGLAGSFPAFIGARCVAAAGSSGQHPVGASLLSSYFPRRRGSVLALNTSIASVGTMLAPLVAGLAVTVVGWRHLLWLAAFLSLFMGMVYFVIPDRQRSGRAPARKREMLAQSMASYHRVLHDRNMLLLGLVFMVGALGRGGQAIQLYLAPHLVRDFGFKIALAGAALSLLQAGGLVGPLVMGWISDRMSRRAVIQASMLLSGLATLWLGHQGPGLLLLGLNLVLYGAFTSSRGSLTQALVADSVSDADQDAAFSIYFFLGFATGPILAIVTGLLVQNFGFSTAFTALSLTFFTGMLLMFLVKDDRGRDAAVASKQA